MLLGLYALMCHAGYSPSTIIGNLFSVADGGAQGEQATFRPADDDSHPAAMPVADSPFEYEEKDDKPMSERKFGRSGYQTADEASHAILDKNNFQTACKRFKSVHFTPADVRRCHLVLGVFLI